MGEDTLMPLDATTSEIELLNRDTPYLAQSYSGQWVGAISAYGLNRSVIDSLKTIFGFKQLTQNWDSYGSPPPTRESINSASGIIKSVSTHEELSYPHIMAVSGGGIQISWEKNNRELDLVILHSGEVEFLQSEGDDVIGEGEVDQIDQNFRDLANWVSESES